MDTLLCNGQRRSNINQMAKPSRVSNCKDSGELSVEGTAAHSLRVMYRAQEVLARLSRKSSESPKVELRD